MLSTTGTAPFPAGATAWTRTRTISRSRDTGRGYRPLNSGLRFSAKARAPSMKSSEKSILS